MKKEVIKNVFVGLQKEREDVSVLPQYENWGSNPHHACIQEGVILAAILWESRTRAGGAAFSFPIYQQFSPPLSILDNPAGKSGSRDKCLVYIKNC